MKSRDSTETTGTSRVLGPRARDAGAYVGVMMSTDSQRVLPIGRRGPREPTTVLELVSRERCVACGSDRVVDVWSGSFSGSPTRQWIARHRYAGDPVRELGEGAGFRLVRCRDCTMLFHARVLGPEGIARLYGGWIDETQVEHFERTERGGAGGHMRAYDRARLALKHLIRLRALAERDGVLRVLDFGCGEAHFVRLARLFGAEASGVDPRTARCDRIAREGLRIFPSIHDAQAAGACELDAVVMFEVLEHLVDPAAVLASLMRLIRPGGALLIEVPDARCIEGPPRTFEQFRVVHPLEHVNAFTPRSLESMCRRLGLTPVRPPAVHVTSRLSDVARAVLGRYRPRATSQYFLRG